MVALMGCSSKKSQFESEFMDGCVGKNGGREQKKICSCVMEKLETRHSIDELTTLVQQQPQQVMLETVSYARDCATK